MRFIAVVYFLLLSSCVPVFANSMFPVTSTSTPLIIRRAFPNGGALFGKRNTLVADTKILVLSESSTFWFISTGMTMLLMALTNARDRARDTSQKPRPSAASPFQDSITAERDRNSWVEYSELEKHIVRLVLLGLTDHEISVVLHLPLAAIVDHVARLMALTGSCSRREFVFQQSCDPRFQQWFRFVNSSLQVEYAKSAVVGRESD